MLYMTNKTYYSLNREKILEKMKEKINCPLCEHSINRCYMTKHQGTPLCEKRQKTKMMSESIHNDIKELKEDIENLKKIMATFVKMSLIL